MTYDRRGQTRSILDDETEELWVETESDDVHHLLTTLGGEPVYVFGSSIGAVIALDLAEKMCEALGGSL